MNKFVIVTGATKGLGLAITERLSGQGFSVIGVARSESSELTQLCSRANVHFEQFDLSKIDQIHDWVKGIVKKYGRIYGLVNNAAIGCDGVLGTMHESEIYAAIQVNLHSPIILTKYVARSMLLNGEGRIVNVSSIIASTGFSGLSVYAATKSGLVGFTKSLSRELGKANITVNCVAPGYMETDMTKGIQDKKMATIKRRSPSGKLATVESVSAAVALLIGDDGEMLNGTTITVDAGSTA